MINFFDEKKRRKIVRRFLEMKKIDSSEYHIQLLNNSKKYEAEKRDILLAESIWYFKNSNPSGLMKLIDEIGNNKKIGIYYDLLNELIQLLNLKKFDKTIVNLMDKILRGAFTSSSKLEDILIFYLSVADWAYLNENCFIRNEFDRTFDELSSRFLYLKIDKHAKILIRANYSYTIDVIKGSDSHLKSKIENWFKVIVSDRLT